MEIKLGNLSPTEIERRLGVKFDMQFLARLNDAHCELANDIPSGCWHCFDTPFQIVCGGKDIFEEIQTELIKINNLTPIKPAFSMGYL